MSQKNLETYSIVGSDHVHSIQTIIYSLNLRSTPWLIIWLGGSDILLRKMNESSKANSCALMYRANAAGGSLRRMFTPNTYNFGRADPPINQGPSSIEMRSVAFSMRTWSGGNMALCSCTLRHRGTKFTASCRFHSRAIFAIERSDSIFTS